MGSVFALALWLYDIIWHIISYVAGFLEVFRLPCILKCSGVFGVSRRCFGGVLGLLALLRNISTTGVRGFHQRFQTPRNWWQHDAAGGLLLLLRGVWNLWWNTKYESLICNFSKESWMESTWLNRATESLFFTRKYENPVPMSLSGNCFAP